MGLQLPSVVVGKVTTGVGALVGLGLGAIPSDLVDLPCVASETSLVFEDLPAHFAFNRFLLVKVLDVLFQTPLVGQLQVGKID